jgi:hypothetical protein
MGNLLETRIVDGPRDRTVRLRFYDDNSMRIELPEAGPMVLTEAFLSGKAHTVVIKLDPKTRRRNTTAAGAARPKARSLGGRKVPIRRGERSAARSAARAR